MSTDDVTQPYFPTSEPTTWAPTTPPARRGYAPPRPPRRRGGLWGCLGVALGFVAGVIVTALLALALFAASPAPAATSAPGAVALKVTLTDTLLTAQLVEAQRNATGGVLAQPRVHVRSDGKIMVSGALVDAGSFTGATATVVARPYVSQGKLAVTLTNATVGGIPIPLTTVSAVGKQINEQLARVSRLGDGAGASLVVSAVSFSDGAMTLSYVIA
ncbi:MAG TPA: hypothetical protein VF739_15515 [Ktedonobacterales bacterium]